MLAASKLGAIIDTRATLAAAKCLHSHHGSSAGGLLKLQMGPPSGKGKGGKGSSQASGQEWDCNRCEGSDGTPFRNWHYRTHCHKCKVHKGKCYGGQAKSGGSPTKSLAQRQVEFEKLHKKNEAIKFRKQNEDLRKQNADLKKKIAENSQVRAGSDSQMGEEAARPAFDKKVLYERIKFYESVGQKDCPDSKEQAAKAREKLTELQKAELDSKPVDEQVKKARRHVEACCRAMDKADKEHNEFQDKIKELQEKCEEARAKKTKASEEHEAAKRDLNLILKKHSDASAHAPNSGAATLDWSEMAEGCSEVLKALPPDILEQQGLDSASLVEQLQRFTACREAARARRAAAEAAAEKQLAEEEAGNAAASAAALGHAPLPGRQHAFAHAEAAKPVIVDDDVLMGLCEGSDEELAKAARLILESEVVVKRRKLGST